MRTILEWLGRLGLALVFLLFAFGAVVVVTDGGWNVVWGVLGFALFGFGAFALFTTLRPDRPRTVAAPTPLPAESRGVSWFDDVDEDVEEPEDHRFTPDQRVLLEQLRGAARSLPFDGVSSEVDLRDDAIVGSVWVAERTERVLFSIAIHLSAGRLRGGRFHQYGQPPDTPPLVEATGDNDELVRRAVDWLDTVLRRPVERLEWWYAGRPYAVRYQFADTGDRLLEAFDRHRAPWGHYRRLLAARPVPPHTDGEFDTSLLGNPHATIAVRANGRALPTPPIPRFTWYPHRP